MKYIKVPEMGIMMALTTCTLNMNLFFSFLNIFFLGIKTKQMHSTRGVLPKASVTAQKMAYCTNLADARKELSEAMPTDEGNLFR
jgi:hypothetical protein